MVKEWLEEYQPQNEEDIFNAMREIMQEIALAGLSRTDFFDLAAFYGGTALRIFYGLDRFSEDLDFSLFEDNPNFSLEPYFDAIIKEFEALGIHVQIREKIKRKKTSIESAFLKNETLWKELVLEDIIKQIGIHHKRTIKIKIEVDTTPPQKFNTEEKLLLRPYSFYVRCFTPSSLFAGKMHALLFRKWKNRVKGRDWYDMEWYIRKGIPLDLNHFLERAKNSGDWQKNQITSEEFRHLLENKIRTVEIPKVKEDIVRFIQEESALNIWSKQYFLDLTKQIVIM